MLACLEGSVGELGAIGIVRLDEAGAVGVDVGPRMGAWNPLSSASGSRRDSRDNLGKGRICYDGMAGGGVSAINAVVNDSR